MTAPNGSNALVLKTAASKLGKETAPTVSVGAASADRAPSKALACSDGGDELETVRAPARSFAEEASTRNRAKEACVLIEERKKLYERLLVEADARRG